jgi:hypothetical protein
LVETYPNIITLIFLHHVVDHDAMYVVTHKFECFFAKIGVFEVEKIKVPVRGVSS